MIVASEEAVRAYNLTPLARLVAFSTVGVQPEIMGIGPVPAIQNVLKVANEKLENIDLIEVSGRLLIAGGWCGVVGGWWFDGR